MLDMCLFSAIFVAQIPEVLATQNTANTILNTRKQLIADRSVINMNEEDPETAAAAAEHREEPSDAGNTAEGAVVAAVAMIPAVANDTRSNSPEDTVGMDDLETGVTTSASTPPRNQALLSTSLGVDDEEDGEESSDGKQQAAAAAALTEGSEDEPDIEIPATSSSLFFATTTTVDDGSVASANVAGADQQRPQFPPPFYCPITNQLFLDPVVAPDGLSYERTVLLQTNPGNPTRENSSNTTNVGLSKDQVYPNRALQRIMEEYLELTEDSWEAGIRRFQKSIETGIQQLWERSIWPTGGGSATGLASSSALPDAYYCPITFDLMHVPVIDPEGNTYEQAAIVSWIRANGNSPLSRSPLTVHDLYPNHVIRQLLEYHSNPREDGTPVPPALVKWKTESPPLLPEAQPTNAGTTLPLGDDFGSLDAATMNAFQNPYPTTFEQLDEYHRQLRRQRQKVFACTVFGCVCLVLAVVAAVLYGGYCIFVSIWVGCCVRDSLRRLRQLQLEHAQEEDVERQRLEDTQQRIHNLTHRLEELQQQQQTNHASTSTATTTTTPAVSSRAGDTISGDTTDPYVLSSQERRNRLQQLEEHLSQLRLQILNEELALRQERHQDWLGQLRQQQEQEQEQQEEAQQIQATTSADSNVRLANLQERVEELRLEQQQVEEEQEQAEHEHDDALVGVSPSAVGGGSPFTSTADITTGRGSPF